MVQERLAKKTCPNRSVLRTILDMIQNPCEGTEDKVRPFSNKYGTYRKGLFHFQVKVLKT